jgi:hypothetical protein
MHYTKQKHNKSGICNICQIDGPLTWDHVPPRTGGNSTEVEVEQAFQRLNKDQDARSYISQNGLKYRTICKTCNSLLGDKYDPTINNLNIGLARFINTHLHLPSVISYSTKPITLMKGLLGHLLASKIDTIGTPLDILTRSLLFKDDAQIPEDIHIFYWIYPYNQTVIVHDIAMPKLRGTISDITIFSAIKFFPIAYLITDIPNYGNLDSLSIYRNNLTDTQKIPVRFTQRRSTNWPENTEDNNLMIVSSSKNSVRAKPRMRQNKRK